MSTASATIAFRVTPEIKRRADRLFTRLGMTTSTGMNVLLMQTLQHRGFPFPVVLPAENDGRTEEQEADEVPKARVRATLDSVLAGTEPMHGPFKDVDEMFDTILKGE